MAASETIVDAKAVCLDISAGKQGGVARHLVFNPRGGKDEIQEPIGRYLPANSTTWKHGIAMLHVHSDSKNKLEIWTIDVGATENERHVKGVAIEMIEGRVVKTGLSF